MNKYYSDFIKERNQVLESRSIDSLTDFVLKYAEKGLYDPDFALKFKFTPNTVKLATLCKMICATNPFNEISKETVKWAKETLKNMNMKEEITL